MSESEFNAARAYGIDKSVTNMVQSTINHLINTALISVNFYAWLWSMSGVALSFLLLRTQKLIGTAHELLGHTGTSVADKWFASQNEILHSIVFLVIVVVFSNLLTLPVDIYNTFVVEQRHGFNKQTRSLFLADWIKSLLIGFVIGIPAVAATLWIINSTGDVFFVWLWLFVLALQLLLVTIYPTVIQPLFNTFTPLPDGSILKEGIESLARAVKFPLTKIFIIDGSKRSNHSNAYFYGFFKNKRIVLFDTLIEQVADEQEILAVIAHEIGHWFHSHTMKHFVVAQSHFLLMLYAFSVSPSPPLFSSFGFHLRTVEGKEAWYPTMIHLLLFSFIYSPVELIVTFVMNLISRHYEFQADAFAREKFHMADELSRALIKLNLHNKGILWPDKWYSAYHFSHPPVLERIERLGSKDSMHVKKNAVVSQVDLPAKEQSTAELKDKYLYEQVLRKRPQ